jgi:endoglucanase
MVFKREQSMNILLRVALIYCFAMGGAFAQAAKYPFPQNVIYPFGVLPTKKDALTTFLKTWYGNWKSKYLQECSGNVRPGVDPLSKSLVEAQGFSMVAVAYMGDKDVFDKLYAYYKAKCTTSGCGLMGWKQTCSGFEDQGSATDGDVDVASALVVASWQWPGGGYDEKAKSVIANLSKVVVKCTGGYALAGGCSGGSAWGGCDVTDISYYEPAFFRYFAKLSGDTMWSALADFTHTIRDNGANAATGLVPDWQSVSGSPGPSGRNGYYGFDALRAPYKQTLDYLWNGNAKALAWCKKISDWAYGFGVSKIKDGFQLNGTLQGNYHNMASVGSLGVAAMANTQQVVNAFADECTKLKDESWYCGYLGNLYLLALSGNMWNPEIVEKSARLTQPGGRCESAAHQLTIRTLAGDRLVFSGLSRGSIVLLTTLDGRIIMKSAAPENGIISMEVSKAPRGCCIVRIESGRGGLAVGRVLAHTHSN